MHDLTAWKENEINRLRKDLDAIFQRCCRDFGISLFTEGPGMQVHLTETDTELILTAEMSGIRPEDIEISASEDSIVIEGTCRSENVTEGEGYRKVETQSSAIRRRIALPVRIRVEEIQAEYENQRLKIVIPKCDLSKKRSIKPLIR
ncbi:MAG: Hsp20/alpha crystallin family protein [Deltaproteobacteria bacterium]|nr:Hsp20/alpha crystallin family protein [Deltaproteobacteria bacterium]